MRLIVDLQGFKDGNKFIPKELATYDGSRISHYIFKQPHPISLLSPKSFKQTVWLMKNHHHIDWNIGFTPLHYFSKIVCELTQDFQFVYVKGAEKADYIRKYCKNTVIEICEEPILYKSNPKCFFHSKTPSMCALSNVFYLYDNCFMNE